MLDFIEITEGQIYQALPEMDTVTLYEELPEIFSAIDLHKRGLKEILLYEKDKDKLHISQGTEMAFKATERIFASLELLYEAADLISKTICLTCGHKNSIYRDYCVLCNSLLPKDAPKNIDPPGTEMPPELCDFCYIVTENLNILLEGYSGLSEGHISREKFLHILNHLKEKTKECRDNPEYNRFAGRSLYIQLKDIFEFAFSEFSEGIENMISHVEDRKEGFPGRGLTRVFEGARYFYYIQNLAIEAERELGRRKRES